jgi:phage internal scaffolding protein
MKFQTPYTKNPRARMNQFEDSTTEQSHKDELKMENILSKYHHSLAQEHRLDHRGMYGFASSATLTEAMEVVHTARDMFNELPSAIRNKFENDPAKFLDFVQDEANAKEMVSLGLATDPNDIPSKIEQLVEYTMTKVSKKASAAEASEEGKGA